MKSSLWILALASVGLPALAAPVAPPKSGKAKPVSAGSRPAATAKPAPSVLVPGTAKVAEAIIREDRLRNFLTFIASDALGGRDTPSPGLDAAAEFLAFHLRTWGYQPAGDDGTYFQRIVLLRSRLDRAASSANLAGTKLEAGKDWFVESVPGGDNGRGTANGACAYVGHGWQAKAQGIDPYAGLDLRGKVVLVTGATPPGLKADATVGREVLPPGVAAARQGAVGIVVVSSGDAEAWGRQARARENMFQSGRMRIVAPEDSKDSLPVIGLSPARTAELLDGEAVDPARIAAETASPGAVQGVALGKGRIVSFTVARTLDRSTTQNVVATLEGADPVLRKEYVALGAHYDHVGTRGPAADGRDRIFNGADDDGSGTTGVLSAAEAFAAGPRPKRSILLVWHCGEEKGLWGSEFYVNHPTVPLGNIVAQLNIDMIGRSKRPGDTDRRNAELSGPNGIYVIGSRMLSTQLGDLSDRVNAAYLKLGFDYRYDDPKDPNRFYYRSDHYNYAAKGIPIIFYFDGVHEDYHRESDEVSKIDFAKMAKVTRTIYLTGMALADRAARP
ncbi:MAG: M28 family peptidase, partial [Armatimonadota bacterium]